MPRLPALSAVLLALPGAIPLTGGWPIPGGPAALAAVPGPASASPVLDLTALSDRVDEGIDAGGDLVRVYARLRRALDRESRRGLRDDLAKVRAAARACAKRLFADVPLRVATADAVDAGAAAVRARDAEVLGLAGLLEGERRRERILALAAKARAKARAGELEASFGNDAPAADLLRRAAVSFEGAARLAGRFRRAETPRNPVWTVPLQGRAAALLGVWGESGPEPRLYAVGAGDASGPQFLVLHPGAEGWVRVPVAASGDLWWVAGVPGDGVWTCGTGGRVARYDPASGSMEDRSAGVDAVLYGIWGSAAGDVWAVGGDPDGVGPRPALLHWDGGAWSQPALPAAADDRLLYKVWGAAADDVWAVGQGGLLLHFDGDAWSEAASGTPSTLITVHGPSPVTAVGGGAAAVVVERGPEGVWTPATLDGVAPGSGPQFPEPVTVLNGVHVRPSGDALAVGPGRTVLRRGEDGWSRVAGVPSTVKDFHAVWIDDAGNALLAGGKLSNLTDGFLVAYGKRRLPASVVPRTRFQDVAPLLFASCAHSGCHLPPFTNAGLGMDDAATTYANLVSVPSVQSPLLRVSPGRLSQSYLWHKLLGTHESVGGTGGRMPTIHESVTSWFTDAQMDLVRGWILDGARDD